MRRIVSLETEDIRLTADLDDQRGADTFWHEVVALMKKDSDHELPENGLVYLIRVKQDNPCVMVGKGDGI
jgi:hypothetical protein